MGESKKPGESPQVVTLKAVAEHLGLTAGTVSAVLNDAPSARSIPEATKIRIHAAAKELAYQPNFFARSLRKKKTYTIGVIAEEIGDSYSSLVITGIEEYLRARDYFFLTVAHRHNPEVLKKYWRVLSQRGVEGVITIDTSLQEIPTLPTVAVAGHRQLENVTNIYLDHERAAFLGLSHLISLSHERIAFFKGHPLSSDSKDRWDAIVEVAARLGITIHPELVMQIDIDDPSPQSGYPFAKQLLAGKAPFTALFAYNDVCAIGAIRAFQEAGLRVPQDISVMGFDDIREAAFHYPSLTTIRQPLIRMGQVAAETLLQRVESDGGEYPAQIAIEPELVPRESTAAAAKIAAKI
jgi:DNA-binding LacI/PurR family transcriptional regulator